MSKLEIEIPDLHNWAVDQIMKWSRACGRFLEWEKEHMLQKTPSKKDVADHREVLTWMLRLTKLYYATVSDPDFPDRKLEREMRGRLHQLQESWELFQNNPMSQEESDKLITEIFPDERRA